MSFLLEVSPDLFIHPCWGISLLDLLEPDIRSLPPCFQREVLFPLYLCKVTAAPKLWTKDQHVQSVCPTQHAS